VAEPLEFDPSVAPSEPLLTPPPPEGRFMASPEEEIKAKARLGWLGQSLQRSWTNDAPPDPSYHVWRDMQGYEIYAGTLAQSRSKAETDALKRMIDSNRRDQRTAASGELGIVGDLMAGAFDPVNLIPIPAVKGIGLIRGALKMGAATGAISAGTELVRLNADPTGEWNQMPGNIALASLLGGLIGAPVGMWGARAARAERAIRAFEADIGNVDSPFHSLRPRSAEGLSFESGRPPRNADGSWPLFAQVEHVRGYEPKTVDGVRYVSEDGITWTTAAEQGRAAPLSVSDDIAEQLGTPVPIVERVQMGDEVRVKAEFNKAEWHDELQGYVDGDANIRHIVRDANDFYNFRHYQHLYEQQLPRLPDETPQAWRQRVGTEAMREYRASQQTGDYATMIGRVLGRLNFSPVVKAIRLFSGDNRVANLSLMIGGDYKWAIEGSRTRWSAPPSLILKSMRHTPRFHQFQNEFMAEWVKYASGDQSYGGRTFQGLNVSAAGYQLRRGLRRGGGAQGMTLSDFEEMVTEAVFNPNPFEVRGFPVNDNARAAAKAFTRMAQEYDDLLRASGVFRDQKNLTRDVKHWNRQRTYYQNRVMEWLWGETGRPANLQSAIRVKGAAEKFTSYDQFELLDSLDDQANLIDQYSAVRWKGKVHFGETHQEVIERVMGMDPAFEVALEANPNAYLGWVRRGTGDRIFTGATHEAAIERMIDELGDDGIALSEQLTADDYGYTYRAAEGPPPAPVGPAPDQQPSAPGAAPEPAVPDLAAIRQRLQSEDLAEQARLRQLVEGGLASRDDEAALRAITRRITRWQAEDMFGGKSMAARMEGDPFAYDPVVAGFKSVGEVFDHFGSTLDDFDYAELINKIYEDAADIPIRVLDRDQINIADDNEFALNTALGRFIPREHQILLRGDWGERASGTNPEVVLHEALHGVTARRIAQAELDRRNGLVTPYTQVLDQLEVFHGDLQTSILRDLDQITAGMDLGQRQALAADIKSMTGDIHEVMTYALTHKPIRDWLKTQPAGAPKGWIKTKYDELIALIAKLMGWENPTPAQISQLDRLMSLTDRFTELEQPLLPGERMPGLSMAAREEPHFVSVGDAMEQRVRRMSPAQLAIFEERAGALRMAEENLAKAQADLKTVTETPHQFLDANGRPEPWYHRIWDKSKGATDREQLTRLIAKWFERDNPDGARQRAELAVDNILNEDVEIAGTGTAGMSALRQRTLNMPNSWYIEDPDFGTIKVADFIDKRMLSVAENYVKKSGVQIESAKMFGPGGLRNEQAQQREYLIERYWDPASPADKPGIMARIDELEGQQQIAYRSVAGTLRTTDPTRVSNRVVRVMKDLATLGVMGKVAFASIAEIVRPGMVNGFATQFNVILTRYLGDLEKIRGNVELNELTGELFDLASKMHHVQAVTIQDGEPSLGGTWFEQLIHDQVPNLYKISGLTSLTTWQKTMTGLAAQHSVMEQAIAVGEALRAGRAPDQKMLLRLNAMGIGPRDALLLSQMPVERYQGGRLILPDIDNWKGLGANGRRAREVLLNGIHAEMRRTVITPSVGDRSTVFNGVWTRGGKVVAENDIMTIPMQFLSYGMGAHNGLLISALQGRDRTLVMGMFSLLLMGMFANWLKTDSKVWQAKTLDQLVSDGFDSSGIGGFWFSNLNTQIERASSGELGVRPLLGIRTGYDKQTADKGLASGLGVAPGYFYDLSRAFWDSSISATERAQLIRKGVPYNNVVWWARVFDEMASGIGGSFERKKQ
jgi:hypothetical protein